MRGKENARRGGKKRTRGVISKGRERRNQEEQELEKKEKKKDMSNNENTDLVTVHAKINVQRNRRRHTL